MLIRESRAPYTDGLFPLTRTFLYTLQWSRDSAPAAGTGLSWWGRGGGGSVSFLGSGDGAATAENQAEAASCKWLSRSVELRARGVVLFFKDE